MGVPIAGTFFSALGPLVPMQAGVSVGLTVLAGIVAGSFALGASTGYVVAKRRLTDEKAPPPRAPMSAGPDTRAKSIEPYDEGDESAAEQRRDETGIVRADEEEPSTDETAIERRATAEETDLERADSAD